MNKLRLLSLCAGIGGADLAAEATGEIEVIGQVEIDPFCQKVLAKHWPDVKRMSDIKEVTGDEFGAIDLVMAGFPCQPHSLAGQRRASKDERDLWPEVRRLIGTIRPRWCVAENPPGLLTSESGRFFGSMLSDLDALGYRVGWCVYGACEVGAPHIRKRIFIVAYSPSARREIQQDPAGIYDRFNTSDILAHPDSDRQWIGACEQERFTWSVGLADARTHGTQRSMANASGSGRQECNVATIAGQSRHVAWRTSAPGKPRTTQPGVCRGPHELPDWMDRDRWSWPAPPGCEQYPWEPSRTITHKIRDRVARLKALGNAIVPAQIYPIFDAIVMIERQQEHG